MHLDEVVLRMRMAGMADSEVECVVTGKQLYRGRARRYERINNMERSGEGRREGNNVHEETITEGEDWTMQDSLSQIPGWFEHECGE